MILCNPFFVTALKLCKEIGAVGLCRAHSGTLLGLLLDRSRCDEVDAIGYCKKSLGSNIQLHFAFMVGGGPRISILSSICQKGMGS
jgi:hypothetical protein